jgi:zinc/manganese transport system substrate-binding protein
VHSPDVISKREDTLKEASMMLRRQVLLAAGLSLLLLPAPAMAQTKLKVVATFSILADLAASVGGERVDVASLVGPDGDTHVFAPTPADARRLAEAKVVVMNGLGLEGWMTRLIEASGTRAAVIVATQGIKTRRMDADEHGHGEEHAQEDKQANDHGAVDPHAWQSVANAKVYVANIRDGLSKADPAGSTVYAANAAAYLAKLDALEAEVKAAVARIPAGRRKIITNHDAFGYFSAAYGIQFISPEGVSTDTEPSAKDVAKVISQIRKEKIPAVFMENISDPRLMRQIARESGARIGGKLFSDALSGPGGPAATYLDMMRSNLREFSVALTN